MRERETIYDLQIESFFWIVWKRQIWGPLFRELGVGNKFEVAGIDAWDNKSLVRLIILINAALIFMKMITMHESITNSTDFSESKLNVLLLTPHWDRSDIYALLSVFKFSFRLIKAYIYISILLPKKEKAYISFLYVHKRVSFASKIIN